MGTRLTSSIESSSGIDQLATPEHGQLYLFSLHVVDDALASNTLPVLIDVVSRALGASTDAVILFNERLPWPPTGTTPLRPAAMIDLFAS